MTDNDKTPIIEPCPMPECADECYAEEMEDYSYRIACMKCGYRSYRCSLVEDAITAHNQLYELVAYGQRAIAACEDPPKAPPTFDWDETDETCEAYNTGYMAAVQAVRDLLIPKSDGGK